ncbi:Uncharacterised protein [Chlamydia trachomatis]|nr:Uncharacterised protein [Chlamydia trachomatis]
MLDGVWPVPVFWVISCGLTRIQGGLFPSLRIMGKITPRFVILSLPCFPTVSVAPLPKARRLVGFWVNGILKISNSASSSMASVPNFKVVGASLM